MAEEKNRTVMAVGVHHDDNEVIAGTLKKYKLAGWRVVSVVVMDCKSMEGRISAEHTKIREAESLAAAELLGIGCEFLRLPEGQLDLHKADSLADLVGVIRKYRPQVVITHPPKDYHCEHEAASRYVYEAVMRSSSAYIETESVPVGRPKLYYKDSWFAPFTPEEYVDISEYIDLKLDMLRCHKSQLNPDNPDEGMIDFCKLRSRQRGIEAGVEYAEAFRIEPMQSAVRVSELLT